MSSAKFAAILFRHRCVKYIYCLQIWFAWESEATIHAKPHAFLGRKNYINKICGLYTTYVTIAGVY